MVEGDARLENQLEQAGLATAAEVVVVCGTDATNAEVVAASSGVQRAPGAGPLRAAVHLSDAGLCALMRHQSLRTAASGVRFDFFDVYSAGARLLLSYHPLAAAAGERQPQPGLAQQAHIDAVDIDLERPGRDASDQLHAALARGVTTVAVCFDDDARRIDADSSRDAHRRCDSDAANHADRRK